MNAVSLFDLEAMANQVMPHDLWTSWTPDREMR